MISDGWIMLSPLLLCATVYLLVAWGAAALLTARVLNRSWRHLVSRSGAGWLRWGWMLTLSGGWLLLYNFPPLLRADFTTVAETETGHAVGVIMALIYAGLALLIGATLFLLAALESRAARR